VQFAVQPPVIVVWPLTVIPLVRLTPVIQMNVPAGNVIVSPSCAFVSWIACTFASEPSDGQTVPKESDVTKKDSPVAIQRNFPIFSPFFCWLFFDFLLIDYLLANLLAGSAAPRGGRKAVITTAQFWPFFILFGPV